MAESEITVEQPEEPSESPALHPAMQELIEKLMQEVENMAVEAKEKETCVTDPNIDPEDPEMAGLKKTGLELESELEALLATPLVTLPDDPTLQLSLATEKMAIAADQSARTLQYYKNRVEQLEQKHKKYEDMVRKAATIEEALERLLNTHRTEEDKRVAMERRCERTSVIFRYLRKELHFILETYNPEELSTPESIKSMEDLLDALVSKMLENPNDPYVEIDDSLEEGHVTLLLCANLIARHPTDVMKVRFVDPRV